MPGMLLFTVACCFTAGRPPNCLLLAVLRDAAPDSWLHYLPPSLLQPLLKRWQAGGLELSAFGLPAIQAVIEYKWRTFARRLLLWQLAVFVCWLASFFTFAILFQVSCSDAQRQHRGLYGIQRV
jgi:hypothetical protein